MRLPFISLVFLLILLSSCTIQPNSTQPTQNPIIAQPIEEQIPTKNSTPQADSNPPEQTPEQVCTSNGGNWTYFSNTCVDSCDKARSKGMVVCGQSFRWGCECGINRCWNENGCEDNAVNVASPNGCGDFLNNEHIMFGYPSHERFLEREAYILSHDDGKKVARWVSYHLTSQYLVENAVRSDKFKADPDIPQGKRAELEDYKGSGFDRGHIAPSADMLRSQSINDESFFLSNMAPQDPSLNRGIWSTLEDDVRDWAKKRKEVWIIAGPIFDDGQRTIGPNKVGVPQRFYKIVISKQDCNFDSISFIFPNEKGQYSLGHYITSIDEIEQATGLDFLNTVEDTLEERIESTNANGLWSK